MMQQFSGDVHASNGLSIAQMQQSHAPHQLQIPTYQNQGSQVNGVAWPSHSPDNFYETPDDVNRRTLTQEAFDAITRNGGMVNGNGQFQGLEAEFSGDQDMLNQVFGGLADQDLKQGDLLFPYPVGAPLSSEDSTAPSVVSEQSYQFPSDNTMQSHANASASGSEWADSRSSSLSMLQRDGTTQHHPIAHPPMTVSTSQWQQGQSVPVDVDKQWEEFRQAAQARSAEPQSFEQPLAFPTDEAYMRRNSQASMLTQSMGNVNIHTPQPNQSGVFNSPAPPVNGGIAARRQRPRPAPIGLAALRSQSYGGPGQPISPGHGVPQAHVTQDQQLRRIRSAAVMNGGVAHGRIMKSTPGSAQRSPVNWTFANAMVSPSFMRSASHGNLAPPTPMSPHEYAQQEQNAAFANHFTQHPSISETDLEQGLGLPYPPSASVPAQNFSSPPHTPMFYEYPFASTRVGSHVITENTPPQSAPAGQSCFPSNIFATAPQPVHQQAQQQPTHVVYQMQAPPVAQPQQHISTTAPEQQQQMPTVTFAPSQQSNVTTGPPPGIPLQFANGIPTVTAEGTVKMSFPPQAQLMQQQSQQMGTPPQAQYSFVTASGGSPNSLATAHAGFQPSGELLVHQYSPPDAMKRTATPRKPVEMAPKNYTFANHGPLDFVEGKKGKRSDAHDSANSCSPASSNGTVSTI
jgi:hypothetical protein